MEINNKKANTFAFQLLTSARFSAKRVDDFKVASKRSSPYLPSIPPSCYLNALNWSRFNIFLTSVSFSFHAEWNTPSNFPTEILTSGLKYFSKTNLKRIFAYSIISRLTIIYCKVVFKLCLTCTWESCPEVLAISLLPWKPPGIAKAQFSSWRSPSPW